jgi:TldD protein
VNILLRAALLCSFAGATFAQSATLLDALQAELQRNFDILKQKADPAPYFIGYEITDQDYHSLSATLGALNSVNSGRRRYLDVTLRVGTPKLDNYHRTRGESARFTSGASVSLDDASDSIRRRAWAETDTAYRAAAERLIRIRTNTQVQVAAQDPSDDFSAEKPSVHIETPSRLELSDAIWSDRLRNLSLGFRRYTDILTSNVALIAQADNRYFVNTEGSRIEHGRNFLRVMISAQARADDGMNLGSSATFDAAAPSGLPNDGAIQAGIEQVARNVTALLKAPVVEPFLGPAIFSGRAAGVFFHEIFGHRIEGHRQKDETEGQTFTARIGEKVLPDFLSVSFDPTLRKTAGADLNGWYSYDDEGIPARRLAAVENGVLKAFLMSRSPVKGFSQSNGHGRREPGYEVVSRQSNLIVESSRAVPEARLREMLLDEVKKRHLPYGLYFADVTGGFTTTARSGPQAFKVLPVIVYRVYPDGRPDELVRGADIVGTPLASFAKIVATSDKPEVFNGYCGAESGSVPVSAVSPAILVSEIEIEKKQKSQDRPPLMPFPKELGDLR